MKIPTRLLTAAQIAIGAFALAAIVATPNAQPAFAEGQPPARTTPVPHPSTGPLRHAAPDPTPFIQAASPLDAAGHFTTWFGVKNAGIAPSKPILVYTYCVYQNIIYFDIEEVAAAPVFMLQPLAPNDKKDGMKIECGFRSGKLLPFSRVRIVSQDDSSLSNNQADGFAAN